MVRPPKVLLTRVEVNSNRERMRKSHKPILTGRSLTGPNYIYSWIPVSLYMGDQPTPIGCFPMEIQCVSKFYCEGYHSLSQMLYPANNMCLAVFGSKSCIYAHINTNTNNLISQTAWNYLPIQGFRKYDWNIKTIDLLLEMPDDLPL